MKKQLEIIRAYGTDYKIMCPADERVGLCYGFDENIPTPLYSVLCEKIREMFEEMGVQIHVVPYEETTPDDKVIIVGPTHEVCDRMLMKDVRTYQYIVRSSGNRIVIGAWLDHQLKLATNHFINMIRSQWTDSGYLTIDVPDEIVTMPMKKRDSALPNSYKNFVFTYYGGPTPEQLTDELTKLIADLGITRLMFGVEGGMESRENLLHAAELARKYGLDITLRPGTKVFLDLIYGNLAEHTDEEIEADVKMIVDTYGDIPEVVDWYVCDEPKRRNAERLARIVDAFHKIDPTRPVTVNHYSGSGFRYQDYLNTFMTKVDLDDLSTGMYMMNRNEKGELYIDVPFMYDLYLIGSDTAQRNDLPSTMIGQFSAFEEPGLFRIHMLEEQLRWQANGSLAYGYKCLSHFTMANCELYGMKPKREGEYYCGMFDTNWKPYRQYYALKTVSPKITAHGRLLVKKKFEMVYHLNTGWDLGAPHYVPFGDLGEVEGENAILSFFSDGTIFVASSLFQKDDPVVKVRFPEYNGVGLEWYDTSDETWKDAVACENITLTNGVYELSLDVGDAEALRVVK